VSNLPTSRNTTYAAGSQVKSFDLDDIQDNIIGHKHPELEFQVPAAAYHMEGSSWAASFNGVVWVGAGGGYQLVAPIVRPAGTRITRYRAGYNRPNAGSIVLQLFRTPLAGGSSVVVDTFTDNATNGLIVKERTVNHTMLAGYGYGLYIAPDATADAAGATVIGGAYFADRL